MQCFRFYVAQLHIDILNKQQQSLVSIYLTLKDICLKDNSTLVANSGMSF